MEQQTKHIVLPDLLLPAHEQNQFWNKEGLFPKNVRWHLNDVIVCWVGKRSHLPGIIIKGSTVIMHVSFMSVALSALIMTFDVIYFFYTHFHTGYLQVGCTKNKELQNITCVTLHRNRSCLVGWAGWLLAALGSLTQQIDHSCLNIPQAWLQSYLCIICIQSNHLLFKQIFFAVAESRFGLCKCSTLCKVFFFWPPGQYHFSWMLKLAERPACECVVECVI